MMEHEVKLSLVIPVMNEKENIQPLLEQIQDALLGIDYEVVLVDDGSKDGTPDEIRRYVNNRVCLIELMKNYGQSTAMAAGIDHASGLYIATLDGDLQNDPKDIPMLLDKIENEPWDMIAGNRAQRQDGFILRKIPSRLANSIIRSLTGIKIKDYGCTLKIFKRDIAKNLGLYGELHRFIPVLAALQGARITQVDVRHHSRKFGKSKYGIGRTFKVMSDLVLMLFFQKYLQKPMHIFGLVGFVIFTLGVLVNLYLVGLKILGHDIWGKPLLMLGVLLVIGGIQFITIGILTEVLIRTYYESQNKKAYQIREVVTGEKVA